MERALIAIASAVITGAIFLGAFFLVQFVAPHLTALTEPLPMFFGVCAILFAVLAIIFRSRRDMTRSLSALLGAVNMALLFGVFYLMPFVGPLVAKHHLAPAIFVAGGFAIGLIAEVVILRRMMILARLNREST